MTFSEIGVTHLHYHRWATVQIMEECHDLPAELLVKDMKGSFPSIYDYLAHLYQSDAVWFDRLEGRPVGTRDDYRAPGCTYDLRDVWLQVIDKMTSVASHLGEDGWSRVLSYKSMAGIPFSMPIWQMILHIVNHGTHHRGQITNMIRQLGHKPVGLDLIGFYRNQL